MYIRSLVRVHVGHSPETVTPSAEIVGGAAGSPPATVTLPEPAAPSAPEMSTVDSIAHGPNVGAGGSSGAAGSSA